MAPKSFLLCFSHWEWAQAMRSSECAQPHLFRDGHRCREPLCFPSPIPKSLSWPHPSPTVCLCSVLPLLLAHHHDNQARLFPVGLGLSRR